MLAAAAYPNAPAESVRLFDEAIGLELRQSKPDVDCIVEQLTIAGEFTRARALAAKAPTDWQKDELLVTIVDGIAGHGQIVNAAAVARTISNSDDRASAYDTILAQGAGHL
ncbi:MAG: hypothetical protein DMF56_08535 [Acidobacteria bacterium]|nr:MAG: hypothetical protein DMF56_08535 [Acidobacteriota bacterium]